VKPKVAVKPCRSVVYGVRNNSSSPELSAAPDASPQRVDQKVAAELGALF
jgi:hypothetical protein